MKISKFIVFSLIFSFVQIIQAKELNREVGKRVLMGFKETPSGSNFTFECSPSGPCISCTYSEKSDEKYRCSETGYRIPLKCVELGYEEKEENAEKGRRRLSALENSNPEVKLEETTGRSLLADKSTSQAYITYRSCVPAVNEEKLSVLGFEGVVFVLLMLSGSFLYVRRKQNNAPPANGAVRIPTSSSLKPFSHFLLKLLLPYAEFASYWRFENIYTTDVAVTIL